MNPRTLDPADATNDAARPPLPPDQQLFCGWGYRFVIAKALAIIGDRPPNNQLIVAECADMLRMVGVNVAHAMGPTIDLTQPVIMVWIPQANAGMVIDGWHRIYRATQEGVATLPAHLLSVEEADRIREDRLPPLAVPVAPTHPDDLNDPNSLEDDN